MDVCVCDVRVRTAKFLIFNFIDLEQTHERFTNTILFPGKSISMRLWNEFEWRQWKIDMKQTINGLASCKVNGQPASVFLKNPRSIGVARDWRLRLYECVYVCVCAQSNSLAGEIQFKRMSVSNVHQRRERTATNQKFPLNSTPTQQGAKRIKPSCWILLDEKQ